MILHDLYYTLKPVIPRSAQITLRRQLTLRKLKSVCHVWPIDPEAGKPPLGWDGWPDGKRFALVLTHDVESAKGMERCVQVAEAEKDLGLRSAFYFVAEDYQIDHEVLQYLKTNGFEVGVHGLNHDRSLYKSERAFRIRAPRINKYLKDWGAVGFRSPCMYRNLEWIGYLDIEYDMSTFDTDPFEPQPDGVRTIFPFAVCRKSVQCSRFRVQGSSRNSEGGLPSGSKSVTSVSSQPSPFPASSHPGFSASEPYSFQASHLDSFYVELPYTLPQDHLLFVILKERDIRTWKRKVDWIARNGGMALLNTHPDYMQFGPKKACKEEYPGIYYIEFLDYVSNRYKGEYWHGLPKETAAVWRTMIERAVK
jgi:hypothetical protein